MAHRPHLTRNRTPTYNVPTGPARPIAGTDRKDQERLLPPRLRNYALAILVAALGLLPAPAAAQAVSVAVRPLLPFAPVHRWAPLLVELSNTGAAAQVELRVTEETYGRFAPTEYRLPAQLAGASRRRYWLYVRPHPFVAGGRLTARLIQEGRPIATQTMTLRALDPFDRLVVAIHHETGILGADLPLDPGSSPVPNPSRAYQPPGGASGRLQIAHLKPDEAPDRWAGYDGADMVVLGDVSEQSLTAAQQRALAQWVRMGGTLVVSGGDAMRLRSGFYQGLRPTTPPHGGRGVEPSGASASPGGAGVPLGFGRVHWLEFDLTRPPHRGAPATRAALREALRSAARTRPAADTLVAGPRRQAGSDPELGETRLGQACFAIPQMDAPPFGMIGLFLCAYLICLVPVNYAILRRRDRKEWAWVTTPAIVLLFSALAYVVGYGIKGGRVVVARAGIIAASAGSPVGSVQSFVGLFSPRKTRYDLALEDPTALLYEWRPPSEERGRGLTVEEEDAWSVSGAEIDMWSMRVFGVEAPIEMGEGFEARVRPALLPDRLLDGMIANRTPFDLEECLLVHGARAVPLGRLASGATIRLDTLDAPIRAFGWESAATDLRGDDAEARIRRSLLQNLRGPLLSPTLLGWTRRSPFGVTVDGRTPAEASAHLVAVTL